jgi:hypothetical protein
MPIRTIKFRWKIYLQAKLAISVHVSDMKDETIKKSSV